MYWTFIVDDTFYLISLRNNIPNEMFHDTPSTETFEFLYFSYHILKNIFSISTKPTNNMFLTAGNLQKTTYYTILNFLEFFLFHHIFALIQP